MKKNRVFMFAAAVAALLLAGCDKGASYSSFELSTADFRGADGAKIHWAAQGLYWNEGDVVVINGIEHTIHGSGSSWSTSGTKTNNIKGYFYVAYPYGTMSVSDDSTTVTVKNVDFSGGVVPLACKGKTNKLTLYPCCAVIKSSSYDWLKFPEGCESGGRILASGDIDVANNVLMGGEEIDYDGGIYAITGSDGNNYFVIPMAGKVVNVKISFGWDNDAVTSHAVELRAGYMYTVD